MMPVGSGTIPFDTLFYILPDLNKRYFFVEDDNPADPIKSISQSLLYIRKFTN